MFDPLPDRFRDHGFDFQVIAKEGLVVLLRKTKKYYEGYEVVILHEAEAHTWPGGNTTPAHERMPNAAEWGTYGWTYVDSEGAWSKFRELCNHA